MRAVDEAALELLLLQDLAIVCDLLAGIFVVRPVEIQRELMTAAAR
jgi:hypothetical protein